MRILCICQKGNSRSVAAAWVFKQLYGHEAIAIGIKTTSAETRDMLYRWADRIVLVAGRYRKEIPQEFAEKLRVCDVGTDRWFHGFDEGLVKTYTTFVERGELE